MSKFRLILAVTTIGLLGLTVVHHITGEPRFVGVVIETIGFGKASQNPFTRKQIRDQPAPVDKSLIAAPALPKFKDSLKLEIRALLQEKKFVKLNELLYSLQKASKPNSAARIQLFAADFAFQLYDDAFEPLLNEWIEATPYDYQPYLARANYFFGRAWEARGTKWASETSEDQFNRMKLLLLKAQADVNEAKNRNKYPLGIYQLSNGIAHLFGQDEFAAQVLAEGLEIEPADYMIRAKHLGFLAPRWGGSIDAMNEFVSESLEYLPENPRLSLLTGLVYDEVADIYEYRKENSEAEKYYTQALEYGDNFFVYLHRGMIRSKMDKYDASLEDLNKSISLYPEMADTYYRRSFVYAKKENYEKSTADIIRAIQLDPFDSNVIKHRDWLVASLVYRGTQFDKKRDAKNSLNMFNHAILLNPDYEEAYHRRAAVLAKMKQFSLASDDLRKAISLNPEYFYSYDLLRWVLAREGKYDEIVSLWDKYISTNPDESVAYVERGGAYFQIGDYKKAIENAKLAADMGDPHGIEAYKKYKNMVE